MEYPRLAGMVPAAKREETCNKLVDLILTSKNDDNMPSQLANTILHHWQQDLLSSEHGLAALLQAAILLEPDRTMATLGELQLTEVAESIKHAAVKTEKV